MTGKNLDGTKTDALDYTTASVGAVVPFVGGHLLSKLFRGTEQGIGKELVEGIVKKTENIASTLDEKHVKAAVNDIFGRPAVINGKTYDHLTEVRDALRGLGNQIEKLNGLINTGKVSDDVLDSAKKLRSKLQKKKDDISATLIKAEQEVKKRIKNMKKPLKELSIQEIENDYWKDIEYPTALIRKCYELRKKTIGQLDVNDLRVLISQSIGLNIVIPIALETLNDQILSEGDYYPGDLLHSVLGVPKEFWLENEDFAKQLVQIFLSGKDEVINSTEVTKDIKEELLKKFELFKSWNFA